MHDTGHEHDGPAGAQRFNALVAEHVAGYLGGDLVAGRAAVVAQPDIVGRAYQQSLGLSPTDPMRLRVLSVLGEILGDLYERRAAPMRYAS